MVDVGIRWTLGGQVGISSRLILAAAIFCFVYELFRVTCLDVLLHVLAGHAVAQLVEALRYKVAGSIPDGVIGIFHRHNPSSRTVALGSTQPPTEISTRNISWGVKAAGA